MDDKAQRQRPVFVILAVGWALLGVWSLTAGQTWLGIGQLVMAALSVGVIASARMASIVAAPLFRRK